MHLGLAEADQTFLRWVLRGQRSWLIRRHCPSRIPWCKPTRILSPALDSPTRGLLTGLGYKSLVGVAPVQGSHRRERGRRRRPRRLRPSVPVPGAEGEPRFVRGHGRKALCDLPSARDRRFRSLRLRGGTDLQRLPRPPRGARGRPRGRSLGGVWVEIDRYRDQADSIRVIEGIGKDPEAGSLFGRVLQLAAPGVLCPQANAERVQL